MKSVQIVSKVFFLVQIQENTDQKKLRILTLFTQYIPLLNGMDKWKNRTIWVKNLETVVPWCSGYHYCTTSFN